MKRKQAILGILGIAAGTATTYAGWQWYRLHRSPDLSLLPTYQATIDALAETIIPATAGVPGAQEAGVGKFITTMVRDGILPMEQNKFMEGLHSVQQKSKSRYQKSFEALDASRQKEILLSVMKDQSQFRGLLGKVQNKLVGRSFFQLLKTLTVTGYCTSELGAQQGLAYQYLPGSYQGCVSLLPNQKAWSTK